MHEAARLAGGSQQEGKGGGGAEVIDAAGVDTPDERIDQPLDDRSAQPFAHDVAYRPVAKLRPGDEPDGEEVPRHPE